MILPERFKRSMQSQLGDEFPDFEAALQSETPVSVRVNPSKPFDSHGWTEKIPWTDYGYYLPERPVFTLDPAFHAGAYYVQEASSMVIEQVLKQHAPKNGPIRVLDLCAAPGGKTTHLASLLGPDDLLVANEVIKGRVGVLRENLMKWGYPNVIVSQQDPETFADLEGFFDVVLVDAPCSGEGMFRKTPDATSEWSEGNVELCSSRQKRILSAAAMLVAPDGILLYSTCTYNRAENQENAQWLTRTLDFEGLEINVPESWGIVNANPGLQFYPHRVKGEGFYIAAFRNKSRDERFVKGRPQLARLSRQLTELVQPWIKGEGYEYFQKNDGGIVALKSDLIPAMGSVLKALQKRSSGLELGHFKGKDFVPSHALALSTLLPESTPAIDLDERQALLFLKKEAFELPGTASGWVIMKYKNLALGWAKAVGPRFNNYLPTDWRIRMKLED
jgi:16S rRNA C967 or C1407 C5-methylase (RsmB/RsmF family)/NOL1/NOP2/fmu family ribosome biogenesis protein